MPEPARALSGLSEIAGSYDALFCDVWGVLHNGIAAYPDAVKALQGFRGTGGIVILVTNAPRPAGPLIAMLDRLGVPRDAYDVLVSSGDVSRNMISAYSGRVIHHVGPPTEDDALYEGLDVIRGRAEDAEVIVVTDLDTDDDTPDMYLDRMQLWLERKLPMICANPDKVVEHGNRLVYCGGALADLYEAAGGTVFMAGKPYPPIYEEAMRRAETTAGRTLDRTRVLAVGDSARTDATGASDFGIDFLFIIGSIHAEELDAFGTPDRQKIADLIKPTGARMAGFLPRLWP
jgi:HAD superfamily hydrolase (TIGR01459 family)